MNAEPHLTQKPEPGNHLCRVQGDTLKITLQTDPSTAEAGRAWVRTNIGHASITRAEIIEHVDNKVPILDRDWFDIPLQQDSTGFFSIRLGLSEVGHFEAKCFFLPENADEPLWPSGGNLIINVQPADTCCGNTLYNAFVRQFRPDKSKALRSESSHDSTIEQLDKAGYTIIPPSGTFRNLMSNLDFIVGTLGCRILQLLPIHPTPTTYARMGRFGSPYAALSFIAVDPALAEFDPSATPLEQFLELVDAVHARNAKLFLDIAINHTGWAASLHATHPQWLVRNPDGKIEVPGAWGVTWADLTRLDYSHKDLWQYMADIFLTWCRRGVDGFRCDAGYMIPVMAWRYIVASVRSQFPDTIFLLEGLGGKISVTRELLSRANFNWAYSELFQNHDRGQIESYFGEAMDISRSEGLAFHFAETHDNTRLAEKSKTYARMRTSLCALFSFQGAFGFANGVEWFATEKINVHDAPPLNWGAADNQVDHISRLARLLKSHPAFFQDTRLELLPMQDGNCIGLNRAHPDTGKRLLVLINLNCEQTTRAHWDNPKNDWPDKTVDLLSGRNILLQQSIAGLGIDLAPGEVLCLTQDPQDLELLNDDGQTRFQVPEPVTRQCLRTKVLETYKVYRGITNLSGVDLDLEAASLRIDPIAFCRKMNPYSDESRITTWQWPGDVRRVVMVPPGNFLLIKAAFPFRCMISIQDKVISAENSIEGSSGLFFSLMSPMDAPRHHTRYKLSIALYHTDGCEHHAGSVLYLSTSENAHVNTVFEHKNNREPPRLMLGTNGQGAMMRSRLDWGNLGSRYDAFLAANLNEHYPEDRRILLTRCRGWIVFQGYSQELGPKTLERFGFDYSSIGCWEHKIPTGHGEHIRLGLCLEMEPGENLSRMKIYRYPADNHIGRLADHKPVTLILRPDIEDRNFHDTTKAFTGPENQWKNNVVPSDNGFGFHPGSGHSLQVLASQGSFVSQPEWQYMVHHPLDAERGLDPDSDLFSPGFFTARLLGGETQVLSARVTGFREQKGGIDPGALVDNGAGFFDHNRANLTIPQAMSLALDQYVVKRDTLRTVIAGYPWFLDWGRDTLIVTRGLIAAGKTDDAISIVKQFARFEEEGTIPNMIHGSDIGNRDTTDAPLWLYTVCADLARTEKGNVLFEMDCGGRSLRDILISMARSLMAGTPNNIRMDPKTGLLFSPAHFTWMDTNHPAGTPRQGYPIEIQALWHAALELLSQIDTRGGGTAEWHPLAERVGKAIVKLFYLPDYDYLSDCLHASPGISAEQAIPDNALRPNQLLAITLNALPDRAIQKSILKACERLLVPGAIRSLDDQTVEPPLEIVHNGRLVNSPETPYQGRYEGDEDSSRKPAYHNGTAWTWLFPSYCEAWFNVYGAASRETALAWLSSSTHLINAGCVGHIPEILDGDAPHRQRGCDAQAWGVSELLRAWTFIDT